MKVDLADAAAWETLRGQIETRSGAMVACPEGYDAKPFTLVDVEFRVAGRRLASAQGQIVHIAPDGHIVLTFDADAVERLVRAAPAGGSGDSQETGLAGWKKYDVMSKPEKIRVARYGNQAERGFVLRDKDPSLHQLVLNNPGLSARELASLIRSGRVSGPFIRKITERTEWMANSTIQEALLLHPLTPADIAIMLVGKVPLQVAKRLAKSGKGKAQVVAAARRRALRK
jgi:hypothetical protein